MVDGEHPDLEALLGEACLLNVVHTEKEGNTYANIQGASPLPKGMIAPDLFNETRMIDINSTPWEEINALPDFIIKKMYSSESLRTASEPMKCSAVRKSKPSGRKQSVESLQLKI